MDRSSLLEFIKNKWKIDMAITAPQAGRTFDTSRGNARYYLNQLVDEGILIRIQHEHNVWYLLSIHKRSFQKFESIGVFLSGRGTNRFVPPSQNSVAETCEDFGWSIADEDD
jgi:hypothetical protein